MFVSKAAKEKINHILEKRKNVPFFPDKFYMEKKNVLKDPSYCDNLMIHLDKTNHYSRSFLLKKAVEKGRLEYLIYAASKKIKFDSELINIAARNGEYNCLRYVHKTLGYPVIYSCIPALESGNFDCFKYCLGYLNHSRVLVCEHCAEFNNLNFMIFAYENGFYMDDYSCRIAAHNGNLECLQFATKVIHDRGEKITDDITEYASISGSIKCLRFLCDEGYKLSEENCFYSSTGDHLDTFKFAHENGCHISHQVYINIIYHDSVKCLEYLYSIGNNYVNKNSIGDAIAAESMKCVLFLVSVGFELSFHHAGRAVKNDELSLMKLYKSVKIKEKSVKERTDCADLFHLSIKYQSLECFKELLAQGVSPIAEDIDWLISKKRIVFLLHIARRGIKFSDKQMRLLPRKQQTMVLKALSKRQTIQDVLPEQKYLSF